MYSIGCGIYGIAYGIEKRPQCSCGVSDLIFGSYFACYIPARGRQDGTVL